MSSLPNGISHAESAKMGGDFFRSMTELQLLMLDMKAPELANIYVFLNNSHCCNLERLFVQVLHLLQLRLICLVVILSFYCIGIFVIFSFHCIVSKWLPFVLAAP